MRKRTAALVLSSSLATGVIGAVALTPASAATSTNPISHRLAELKSALSGLVSDGTLTQSQADKVATTLDSKLPRRGGPGRHGPFGGPGGHGPRHELRVQEFAAAAKTLKLTPAQLRDKLRAGTSLAAVAKAQGVSVNDLVAALVTVAQDQLAVDVKAGRLTQAQSDTIKATLTQRITDRVNHVRPAGGHDGPGHDGMGPDGDSDGSGAPVPPPGAATTAPSSLQG